MNENVKTRSWGAIVVAFILFWPLGLYWYLKRIKVNKKDALNSWKVALGFGILLLIFGFSTVGEGFGVLYLAGGVALIVSSIISKSNSKKIKKYLSVIINSNVLQLDNISSTVGKPYDVVVEDIQKMIDKGFLKDAHIDNSQRIIVLSTTDTSAQINSMTNTLPTRVVTCQCCGANNSIAGDIGECEYCGSALQ